MKQSLALCWINLKSFPNRLGSSFISILSIACVAAVLLGVLTVSDGMVKTLERSGNDNTLLAMRAGAVTELQSVLFAPEVNLLANHPAVVRDSRGDAIVSAEMFVNAEYKGEGNESESIALRGVGEAIYHFRPGLAVIEGEKFTPGLRQLLVGRAVARRIPAFKPGAIVKLGNSEWQVSGIFADGNSVFESEVWADVATVQNDYQRGNTIQSVRLALKAGSDEQAMIEEWERDPRINVRAIAEVDYFAAQAESLTRLIRWIGFPVSLVMAFGALIAALNTMHGTIASRSGEIATHKAIGFGAAAITVSVLSEAVLIALVGGVLGVLPLYILFDGWTAATNDASNLSQMMFNFDISASLITQTLLMSVLIGASGGVLPALKAVRLPVSQVLRSA